MRYCFPVVSIGQANTSYIICFPIINYQLQRRKRNLLRVYSILRRFVRKISKFIVIISYVYTSLTYAIHINILIFFQYIRIFYNFDVIIFNL